ncbi:hypothetical protein ACQVP2_30565 [Methylobacterium aquaticum]|uniref:hypothetical protein n=1 Tax=Methylobacterium aquaticum TaxID=270351 RepID=UPI003D17DE7A
MTVLTHVSEAALELGEEGFGLRHVVALLMEACDERGLLGDTSLGFGHVPHCPVEGCLARSCHHHPPPPLGSGYIIRQGGVARLEDADLAIHALQVASPHHQEADDGAVLGVKWAAP